MDAFEETVEFERVGDVGTVDGGHGVPLDAVLAQQLDGTNDALPGGLAAGGEAVVVVEGLRPVDGEAYEEMVFGKKLAPLVVKQRAVGLQTVGYLPPLSITSLQRDSLAVEGERSQRGFSTVPGEEHLGRGLRLDVFFGESFEELFGHEAPLFPLMGGRMTEVGRWQIIAILASKVAFCPHGLEHHVERSGKRRKGFHGVWGVRW